VNWFDFTLKLKKFPLTEAKQHLKQIQEISNDDYAAYLTKQKQEILNHHQTHNNFYKALLQGKKVTKWEDLPILTKKDLQQPLEERLSDGYSITEVYVNKTSGSSGHPFIFAKDKYAHALTWSVIMNRFGWFGIDFNSSYQARFYGIPLDKIGYYTERLKDWLATRYRFPIFNLNEAKLEEFLGHFKKKKFDYINGYTSSIVLFAKYLQQKNIILKDICPSLKVCMVTSEMLFEKDKILLKKHLGVPIVNEYGASELDLIAFQNPNGNWSLNHETLFIEVVDKNGKALPLGEEGRLVITSLYNKAHPFIRYEIGDIGVLDKKSTPKNPILKKLIGRTSDVAHLPSGKVVPGLTFYYVTKSIIEENSIVNEFVIHQLAKDKFKILYVAEADLSQHKFQEIIKAVETYLEPNLQVELERVAILKRTKGGKLKQFESFI